MQFKPLFNADEQERLFRQYILEPTQEVKNKLIENNLRLINWVIKRYFGRYAKDGYDDLFQSGVLGIIKAIDNYEPDKGMFSTHSIFYIRNAIKRDLFQLTADEAHNKNPKLQIKSLDEEITEEGEGFTLGDITEDPNSEAAYEETHRQMLIKELREVVRYRLTNNQEYDVINMFYGLNSDPLTLEEIGKIYGVTKSRIADIRNKALRNLRRWPEIKKIAIDLDCYTTYYSSSARFTHAMPTNRSLPTSPVERIVLQREEMLKRFMGELYA